MNNQKGGYLHLYEVLPQPRVYELPPQVYKAHTHPGNNQAISTIKVGLARTHMMQVYL